MNEKEFDIIMKNKLGDSNYQPSDASWEALQAKIIAVPIAATTLHAAQKTMHKNVNGNNKKWWIAAAILLPVCAIAYFTNINNTKQNISIAQKPNATESKNALTNKASTQVNAANATKSEDENTNNNSALNIPYKVATDNAIKAIATKQPTANNKVVKKENNIFANCIVYNKDNFANATKNITNTILQIKPSPYVTKISENGMIPKIEPKEKGIAIDNKGNLNMALNEPILTKNTNTPNINFALPNNKVNMLAKNSKHEQALSFAIVAGYGASKGNAGIKQAGVLVQQKLNKRFYADATMQISSQRENSLTSTNAKTAAYGQDVNILSGNYSATAEITDQQKQRAINRVPITQFLCNPSVGYCTTEKTYVALGAELARNIETSAAQLNQDLGMVSNMGFGNTSTKLGNWDAGVTAKIGYRISNKITAEAKYRKGLNNLVENLSGNTKRTYGLLGIIYKLR